MRVRISLYVLTGLIMGGTWASLSRAALGLGQDVKSIAVQTSPLSLSKVQSIRTGAGQKAAHQPLLQFGSEGEDVQRAQTLLQLLGYYSGTVDGRYQEETVLAVSAFQESAGLDEDGVLGPTTWAKLLPSISQLSRPQGTSSTATASTEAIVSSSQTEDPTESGTDNSVQATEANTASNDSLRDPSATSAGTESAPLASAAESEITLPTLRVGMRGPAVRNLQERLSSLGLLQGSIDGVFGSQTEESVKAAQRSFNLTDDGIVGPATWRALLQ